MRDSEHKLDFGLGHVNVDKLLKALEEAYKTEFEHMDKAGTAALNAVVYATTGRVLRALHRAIEEAARKS